MRSFLGTVDPGFNTGIDVFSSVSTKTDAELKAIVADPDSGWLAKTAATGELNKRKTAPLKAKCAASGGSWVVVRKAGMGQPDEYGCVLSASNAPSTSNQPTPAGFNQVVPQSTMLIQDARYRGAHPAPYPVKKTNPLVMAAVIAVPIVGALLLK